MPITTVLTSASVDDNQVSVPLARLSAQRVTGRYTLMDAAYDSEPLRQLKRELGSVPMVAINSRGRENPPMLDAAEKKRTNSFKPALAILAPLENPTTFDLFAELCKWLTLVA